MKAIVRGPLEADKMRMEEKRVVVSAEQSQRFKMLGGSPALDFASTLGGRRLGKGIERLHDYADLLAWSVQAGLVSKSRSRELQAAVGRNFQRTGQIFERSLKLREAIFRIFAAVAGGQHVPAASLTVLNEELVEAMADARIVQEKNRFDWQLPPEVCGLFLPLQAIARDAAELLTSRYVKHVRECASETCGCLFLDTTRNHSRLWCDMQICGNRVKQARFRKKRR
jgi:predicted RNA-binding Zn ribbon-like protein